MTARDLQRGSGPDASRCRECAQQLGKRFISYRTSAAADDIDWVRQALGYEEIALYGDSYGTFLGQSYAYRHADKLEALVLDSAYPAFGESPWYPSLPKTGVAHDPGRCDRSPHCDGDARRALSGRVEVLRRGPPGVGRLIAALIGSAYSPPASYLRLDRAMQDADRGRHRALQELTKLGKCGSGSDDRLQPRRRVRGRLQRLPDDLGQGRLRARAPRPVRGGDPQLPDRTRSSRSRPREIAYSDGHDYLDCLTWPRADRRLRAAGGPGDAGADRGAGRWSSRASSTTSRRRTRARSSPTSSPTPSTSSRATRATSTRCTSRAARPGPRSASSWLAP